MQIMFLDLKLKPLGLGIINYFLLIELESRLLELHSPVLLLPTHSSYFAHHARLLLDGSQNIQKQWKSRTVGRCYCASPT